MKPYHLLALIFLFGCGGGGGGGSSEPAPTLSNITVTLSTSADSADVNSAVTLTWSSTLASSCSASGAWSGSKPTSGSESVTIGVGGSNSFVLSCSATGANSGSASTSVTGLRYFDGTVFDGYIRGAEVFVDTNENLSLDSGETSVVTDNQGNFAKLLYANGTVISKGGIDLDTGADLSSLTLAHKMTGFEASKIISPITSLAAYMAQPADINAALGIDASIDVMSVDPIPNLGQSSYDYIYEKGNQLTVIAYSLQNSVNAINQTTDTSQDYFLGIAEELEKIYAAAPGLVDIESNTFIEAVVENITDKKVTSIDASNKANISSAISSVVPLIQVKSLASTTTAIQNFAFRTMQSDLQSLATGEASAETVTNYTSNLITYISTDQNISATDLEIDISALSDSVSLDEDSSIEISPLINDSYLRGQSVQLSIASSPSNGTTSLTDSVITYTPNADWNGSESFTYSIVQGSKSATGTIEVTVAPINDAPVINAASEFSVNETIQSVATISVTDVDQDDLTFTLSGTDAGLFAISSSGALSFISSPDFENPADSDANNIYDLTVSVSDGTLVDEQVLSVTVLNTTEETNPPVLVSYSVTPKTVDVTSGSADIQVTMNITDETGVDQSKLPSIRTNKDGAYSATVFYTDLTLSSGDKKDGVYTATVTIPQDSLSGTWTILSSIFVDENGAAMSSPVWIDSIEVTGSTVETNPPVLVSYSVTPKTVDVTSGSADIQVTMNITDETGVDQSKLPSIRTNKDGAYSATVFYTDLTLSSGDKKDGVYTATVTIPQDSLSGTWTILSSIFVDENGAAMSSPVWIDSIEVTGSTVETNPPVLVSYSVTPKTVDVTSGSADIQVTMNITDETGVDQSKLPSIRTNKDGAYSATVFYTDLTLSSGDKKDGVYTATVTIPQDSLSGTWTILSSIFVDENGAAMSSPVWIDSIEVTITASNTAPTFTSSATFSAAENQTDIGTVTATDADGDSLTFSISGSEINISSSGVLTFASAPDYETKSSYTATVTVTDGTASVTQGITVSVTDVSENTAPTFTSSATFSAAENQTAIGTVTATDADGDSLTYSISGSEINISSSGVLTFATAPDYETKSSYTATVTVSDGTASVTQDITVNVTDVTEVTNQAPTFTSSATFSAAENQTDIGTVTATDADGDSLTFSISGSEINISSSGVLTFASAPDYETKTSYTATVTVTDGTASATQDITVNVTDVADLTVSGTIFSSRYYVMDSDVPNVNNHDFSSNDTVAAAQELTNPSIVNGFVGTFTTADSVTVEDTIDVYKISTSSNMYVNLDVSQYEVDVKDLDLALYDAEGNAVEFSYASGSTEANETINLPNDGTYLIAVSPIAGASRYLLTLGQRFSSSSIAPKFNYVDGEVLSYIPFVKAGKASEFSDSKFIDPKLKERFNRLSGFQHLEPLMPGLRSLQPAELIAKFEDDISTSLTKAGFKLPSGKMLRYLAQNKVINRLRELNPDAVFDFNHKVKKMTAFSKDPLYYVQWNMERIGLETALNVVGQELKAVGVAVIDTGGPTVNSAAWNSTNFISGGYDFVNSDSNPADPNAELDTATDSSHGTHVATTIGAKNNGNNFNGFPVSVLNVRVLGSDGSGLNSDTANAILYSAGLSNSSGAVAPTSIPIKVINLSLGGSSPSTVLCSAVTDARAQGLVVVAASGNEQAEEPGLINYPAACPGVISVGATNSAGEITGYSNQNVYVDISAPGGDGTDRDGDGNDDLIWAWVSNTKIDGNGGTSMATPHVAGAIATLYAADTSMTPTRVDSMLQSGKLTSDLGATGDDNVYGYGELNMPKMLENLYADNNANSVTFAYTNKYFLDFGNTTTELNITLNKVGSGNLTVSSLSADSAAGLSYTDNSSNGFGSYAILIDRDSMPNGEFSNTVYFNLSDNTEVAVPIYYSVGTPRGRADLGKLYVAIYDAADDSTVAEGDLDMEADGSLGFIASSLANGNYYLLGSTDPDNDGFICSYGELCEYYPKLSSSDDYFTLNGSNISGYEISLGPMFKYGGVQSASLGGSDDKKKKGIKRESVANKILPINFGNSKQTKVFGEKNFIPHSK